MVKKSFERLHKLKETLFMAVATKSRSSLDKGKCDFQQASFEQNILFGRFQLCKPSSHCEIHISTAYC